MKRRQLIIIIFIFGLPVLAYGLTRLIASQLSDNPNAIEISMISIAIWTILLIAPYMILKSSFHNARTENELHVKDLPKNQPKPQISYPDKKKNNRSTAT